MMELSLLSKYRSALMGLATALVIIFHGLSVWDYYGATLPAVARLCRGFLGSVGVDIFLFLSGIGVFFAIENGTSTMRFYKKRLVRLLPSVLIVSGVFWVVKDILTEKES